MARHPKVHRGFIEHEMTEADFLKLPFHKRELITKYGIPIPASSASKRKFKMTPHWYDQLFGSDHHGTRNNYD